MFKNLWFWLRVRWLIAYFNLWQFKERVLNACFCPKRNHVLTQGHIINLRMGNDVILIRHCTWWFGRQGFKLIGVKYPVNSGIRLVGQDVCLRLKPNETASQAVIRYNATVRKVHDAAEQINQITKELNSKSPFIKA